MYMGCDGERFPSHRAAKFRSFFDEWTYSTFLGCTFGATFESIGIWVLKTGINNDVTNVAGSSKGHHRRRNKDLREFGVRSEDVHMFVDDAVDLIKSRVVCCHQGDSIIVFLLFICQKRFFVNLFCSGDLCIDYPFRILSLYEILFQTIEVFFFFIRL